jgi:hypothetical protein
MLPNHIILLEDGSIIKVASPVSGVSGAFGAGVSVFVRHMKSALRIRQQMQSEGSFSFFLEFLF